VAGVSQGLDAWFRRALARAPADRFASAAEMREGLVDMWSPFPLESSSSIAATASGSAGRTSEVRSRLVHSGASTRHVA